MHNLGNMEDNVMYVPGSFHDNYPSPVEDVGLLCTQGLGKVHCHGPVSVEVFQRFLCDDNFRPGSGGWGGGGKSARFHPHWVRSYWCPIVWTKLDEDFGRSC